MAKINITDLKLRSIIGIEDWERKNKQDIVINIEIDFDASQASQSDDINDTLDYKKITKQIIKAVESSEFYLLEKLTQTILDIALSHELAKRAKVRVDKPFALRFADSVSMELSDERTN